MAHRVRIEPMTVADVAAVAAIGTSQADEDQLRAELDRPWSRAWVGREDAEEDVDRAHDADDADHDGATQRGAVVAFLLGWHVADELHVINVATRPDRRRRGIARALLDTALAYGHAHRVRHLVLEVRRSNLGALALYRGVGFFAARIRPRYYPDDEDAVEMLLLLDLEGGGIVRREDEVELDTPRDAEAPGTRRSSP